jgi:acylaminoacyl-peptidase
MSRSQVARRLAVAAAVALYATAGSPAAPATEGGSGRGVPRLALEDLFELEYASDPRISPDGSRVVYRRHSMDIMRDRQRSQLWIVGVDGSGHRPLTSGAGSEASPRWSPGGDRLLYTSDASGSTQLWLRYLEGGETTVLAQLEHPPADLAWSPDGELIAFTMLVPDEPRPFVESPRKPEGAQWAKPPKVIERLLYRADGRGYLEEGHAQVFVVPAEGGTPRQLTSGPYRHRGPLSWAPDGETILLSSNRAEDWEYEPRESEVFELRLADGRLRALTDRRGPDSDPVVSPDGRHVALLGYDDELQGYQVNQLWVMRRDGSGKRSLAADLDRDVESPEWSADGERVFFQYDDEGTTRLAAVDLEGKVTNVASDVGGTSLGRPYSGGSFSLSPTGRVAFTLTAPSHPADVALVEPDGTVRRLTALNDDLLGHRELGEVEEIWFESSYDERRIQGWLVTPPGFDPERRYPLVLEIHGGPFANYGPRFAAEIQLYAARGYVVLYVNPRGSTSYGGELGNLIHHAYPGQDYDDLMSGVDAVLERGYVDPERLYVTGGSGGGVLTSWIVGKTDRFRAAVVAKPVINWTSFVLTSDNYNYYYRYWFPGFPWDHPEHYRSRSPLSLVGNVTTPTMLLTGEVDYRTPISESEQYYQALKLRRVPSALVRIPEASHGLASRPSYLVAKVQHILEWFERYGGP